MNWDASTQSVVIDKQNATSNSEILKYMIGGHLPKEIYDSISIGPDATISNNFKKGNDLWEDMNGDNISIYTYIYSAIYSDNLAIKDKIKSAIGDQTGLTELEAYLKADFITREKLTFLNNILDDFPNVTAGQLRDVVKNYLEENSEIRTQSAALLIWRALTELREEKTYKDYINNPNGTTRIPTPTPTPEQTSPPATSNTSPVITTPQISGEAVIETRIDGEFTGWEGNTAFKLMNGQIWQQTSFNYTYHYAYMPEVLIYKSGSRYKMRVEGVDQTIYVERLK